MPATTFTTSQQFSRLIGPPAVAAAMNLRTRVRSIAAAIAAFNFNTGMIQTLAACCAAGVVLYLVGAPT